MKSQNRQKYLQTALMFATCLVLLAPFPAGAFPQDGGGDKAAEAGKAQGITMQTVSGRVVETMDSGGYTYALVQGEGAMKWVALPKSSLAVGNEITCQPGMVMNNFSSPSLSRNFQSIVFSRGITSLSQGTATPAEPSAPAEAPELPKVKDSRDWGDFFDKGKAGK